MEEVLPKAVRSFTERMAHQSWNSPKHKILRRSKLFSLPPQLARPRSIKQEASVSYDSNTATLPYPTSQAIETTYEGLQRGDWGLKRALPLKSTTNTSYPVIRINGIDSADDVTDFESAGDHYLTRQKWQEMNIPMMLPTGDGGLVEEKEISVFDSALQPTAKEDEHGNKPEDRRKTQGPYLAALQPGEFETYVSSKIRGRRLEFDAFARDWLARKRLAKSQRRALDDGQVGQNPEAMTLQPLTDEEYQSELSRLRSERTRNEITSIIWEFLSLPGSPPHEQHTSSMNSAFTNMVNQYTTSLEEGPPPTHPSAGLSYIRTRHILHNHPSLGPQRSAPPVHARILKFARQGKASDHSISLGIGGVVATQTGPARMSVSRIPEENQETRFEPSIQGGAKMWQSPKRASIDSKGKIILTTERADDDAVAVWEHVKDRGSSAAQDSMGALPDLDARATLDSRKFRYNALSKPRRRSIRPGTANE